MLGIVNLRVYNAHVCLLCPLLLALFKYPGIWDKFDLDCILREGDQLFKFIEKLRYIGMEKLRQEFLVENNSITVEFLENKRGEITAGAYLISISEIVNGV